MSPRDQGNPTRKTADAGSPDSRARSGGNPAAAQRSQAVASRPAFTERRWTTLAAAAVIALASVAVYSNSFSGAFVLDDHLWIDENPNVHHLWPPWSLIEPLNPEQYGGRPVVSFTLALNYALGGTKVWGYHAVNLAIHILAAWTLFGLIRRTLLLPGLREFSPLPAAGEGPGVRGSQLASAATPLALAAALIWTVHPLQTQAVTYVIQRTESLMGLLYLLTLYCVLRGATAIRAARGSYIAAAVAAVLGMATKEVMVTAPLVVLLYDRTFLSGSFRAAMTRRWGLYLIFATSWGIVAWLLIQSGLRGNSAGFGMAEFTGPTYLLTQPGVLVHYLRLAFWPSGQCLDYAWPAAHTVGQIVWPGLLILSLLGLTGWALVKRPALGFLGASFFIILAPTSSFVPIKDAAFEHRMYLSLAAVAMLVVLAGWELCVRLLPRLARDTGIPTTTLWWAPVTLLAAALIALGHATVLRNENYRSEIAILQDAIDKYPANPLILSNLAAFLADRGRTGEAVAYLQNALKIQPDYVLALENLGKTLDQQGKFDEAIEQYHKWMKVDPNNARAYYLLGIALKHQGKLDLAAAQFERALAIDPHDAKALDDLALALFQRGKVAQAFAQWRKAIEVDPMNAKAHNNLATALAKQGHLEEAIDQWQRCLKIDPDYVKARCDLGVALNGEGKVEEAVEQWREAIRRATTPNQAADLYQTAQILATDPLHSASDARAAFEMANRAAQLTGNQDPKMLALLAFTCAETNRIAEAIQIAEEALNLATARGDDALARALREEIKQYQAKAAPRAGHGS